MKLSNESPAALDLIPISNWFTEGQCPKYVHISCSRGGFDLGSLI